MMRIMAFWRATPHLSNNTREKNQTLIFFFYKFEQELSNKAKVVRKRGYLIAAPTGSEREMAGFVSWFLDCVSLYVPTTQFDKCNPNPTSMIPPPLLTFQFGKSRASRCVFFSFRWSLDRFPSRSDAGTTFQDATSRIGYCSVPEFCTQSTPEIMPQVFYQS